MPNRHSISVDHKKLWRIWDILLPRCYWFKRRSFCLTEEEEEATSRIKLYKNVRRGCATCLNIVSTSKLWVMERNVSLSEAIHSIFNIENNENGSRETGGYTRLVPKKEIDNSSFVGTIQNSTIYNSSRSCSTRSNSICQAKGKCSSRYRPRGNRTYIAQLMRWG